MIVCGIVLANVSFVVASVLLYRLSLNVLKDHKAAFVSSLLFCVGPGGPFMSSIYTESPFAMLTFGGMLAFSRQQNLIAAWCWCLASLLRSNGVLLSGFFVYSAVMDARDSKTTVFRGMKYATCIALVWCGMLGFQWYAYSSFCAGTSQSVRPWCHKLLPFIYSFVQQHYWDVGLFNYYTVRQIPNFVIALPVVMIVYHASITYASSNASLFWSLGLKTPKKQATGFPSPDALPYMYLLLFQTLLCLVMLHVQIMGRFLSSMPALYWYMAHVVANSNKARVLVEYLLLYLLTSTLLFAHFLPPA
ncbi:hypothetical protein SeMB42_g01558 [Synchytrium endobioticum]|uniref:GPI mannosyltransferase 2 n=1 Tax=Synchytrium endobioticum TaxID=286115 RepID=A0A507DDH3_9FUNG|nr:hypothetical protein SeLEV6574_g01446 [Synchytrium endobioticum]TPX52217.1 hypothetical protein SeMB42_g01558 [Synchytrium endobioticum]